jgi:1-acyl-sn-glycerol-3-phosphate acyltransferase
MRRSDASIKTDIKNEARAQSANGATLTTVTTRASDASQPSDALPVDALPVDAPRTAAPRPPTLFNYLHSSVAIPLIYLYTIVMGTLSLAVSVFDPRGRRQHWCAQTWCRMIARTTLKRVRVHGGEYVRPGASYVFLSTHQSWMDIPVMLGYLPAQLRIAAKKEVFKIPFLGWHMRRGGHIPIDRGSTDDAVAALRRAAGGISDGICAFIFPEGTRSRDGALQPFKKGGFKLALQAGVPIIPVTIVGTRQVLPRDSIIFRHGEVDMYIDAPIPTANLDDDSLPVLMEAVRARMASHFTDAQE